MNFLPQCRCTGIGSVPFTDPSASVEFIRRYCGEIPHWPQLPLRSPSEGFVEQFTSPLLRIGVMGLQEGRSYFDTSQEEWPELLTKFYTLALEALEDGGDKLADFAFPEETASGLYALKAGLEKAGDSCRYVKGQITGPLSAGFRLTDENRRAAYYNPELRDIVLRNLLLQGTWQIRYLKSLGYPVILFIDDPGLYTYGHSNYISVQREDVQSDIAALVEGFHREGALVGVHTCAAIDWDLLLTLPIDILSIDAYTYFTSLFTYHQSLRSFFERGGVLAWGGIPTNPEVAEEDEDSLYRRFVENMQALEEKGIPSGTFVRQCLITPSCGTATLPPELAERVYSLTADLSGRLRKEFNLD